MKKYIELKERQQKEVNAFPMVFAFSNQQFIEGMAKLGLKPTDTDKVYRLGNTGGIYRKSDSQKLKDMMDRHDKEMAEAIAADKTGEGFIFEMFDYELANHEYCITYDLGPTLDELGITIEQVNANPALKHGLALAIKAQEKCS
jgi:hypothetical protein